MPLTTRHTLEVDVPFDFSARHIGTDQPDQAHMLDHIGVSSLESLMEQALPPEIRLGDDDQGTALPAASEAQVLDELRRYASQNQVYTSMIGQGYYDTLTPSVVQRMILEDTSWYTAYTPYQPEISQGRLEALLNFQTVVSELTGLDVAGSSMLDEGTAAAEAMLLCMRATKTTSRFLVDSNTLARTKQIIRDRALAMGIEIAEIDLTSNPSEGIFSKAGGILVSTPGANGELPETTHLQAWADAAHASGALVVAITDLLAATIITEVAAWGADIAAGSTQRYGVPMGFGGPHAGFLAVKSSLARQLPGRLVGVSKDFNGVQAYRLALQTREQHIRRERATSNICTAQVLLAVMASMYAVYHGPDGLRRIALRVHHLAKDLATGAMALGIKVLNPTFFDTLTLQIPGNAAAVRDALAKRHINIHLRDADSISISTDEVTTEENIKDILEVLSQYEGPNTEQSATGIPSNAKRESSFLEHPVFNSFHTETAMMRYITELGHKDFALDRGMIPLGSCTMKLNAATELAALSWPEFARIHPHAPLEQVQGYIELINELEQWLATMTGYEAVSVQPNAGSQGELAGLLAIRRYHQD